MTTKAPKAKLQFECTQERAAQLDLLVKHLDLTTRKDLLDNAFAILEWAVGEVEQGREIVSQSETDKYVLHMPILNVAKKKGTPK